MKSKRANPGKGPFCRLSVLIGLALFVCLGSIKVICADESQLPSNIGNLIGPEGGGIPALTYSVTLREKDIGLSGSVWLDVQLRNDGENPVVVFWGAYAYDDQYIFRVTRNDGGRVEPARKRFIPSFAGLSQEHFERVPAGGILEYRMVLTPLPGSNGQTYYFREPGDYVVEPGFLAIVASGDDEGPDGKTRVQELWRGYLSAESVSFTVGNAPAKGREREFGNIAIEGQVVDAAGQPVVGAQVAASTRRPSPNAFNGYITNEVAAAQSDEAGRFRITRLPDDCPLFEIATRHPMYDVDRLEVINRPPQSEYEVHAILPSAMTIGGRVVDRAGNAVAGARITCYTDYPNRNAYTDADGRFTLDGVVSQDGETVRCDVWKRGWIQRDHRVSVDVAQDRTWEITMDSEEDHSFSGRAVYSDETLAANMKVTFELVNANGQSVWVKETTTDGQGRFTAVVSESGQVSGRVWLEEQADRIYQPHSLWQAGASDLHAGRDDVELVFDRSGIIRLDVVPTNVLPPNREFRATCYMTDAPNNRRTAVRQGRVGSQGGTIEFTDLSPGRYKVEVVDPAAEHWNWAQEIELAARDGMMDTQLTFRLPELHFGSVRGRVFQPDGQTPLREGRAWLDSSASWGNVDIRNGELWLPQVPAGNVWLSFNSSGYAPRKITGAVRPDQTTDLGDIILRAEERGTGWVEGRILFDDGTPALGTALVGDFFDQILVREDGSFRRQLPTGKLQVAFDISGAPLWPRSDSGHGDFGQLSLARRWDDKLFVPLDVKPGETIQRDIIIPLATLGNVEVVWLGDPDPNGLFCGLAVPIGDSIYSCHSPAYLVPNSEVVNEAVTDVPVGHRIVMLRTSEYCGYQESTSGENDSVFTFDPSQAGSVSGTVTFPTGVSAGGVLVELQHPLLAELGLVRGMRSTLGIEPGTKPGSTRAAEDGSFRFPQVAPGRYVVSAAYRDSIGSQSIDVREGEETLAELTIPLGQ